MFVLDSDESLPADDPGSPWVFSRLNTEVGGSLGLRGAISVGVKYTLSHVTRLALRGSQDAPLRYGVDLAGRFGLRPAIGQAVNFDISMLPTNFGFRSNSQEAGHYTVILVGRAGFNAANFGGTSAQQIFPVWALASDQLPFIDDDSSDDLIEIEVPLLLEDSGAGHFGVNLAGRLGVRAAASMAVRYGLTESARMGFKGADAAAYHPVLTESGRLGFEGSVASIIPGNLTARLGLRGADVILVHYTTSMSGRFGGRGAETSAYHPATILTGRLGASVITDETVHNTVNLAGGLSLRGLLGILVPTSYATRLGLNGAISVTSKRTLNMATRFSDVGNPQMGYSPDVSLAGRIAYVGATEEGLTFTVDLAGRLWFGGEIVVVVRGTQAGRLALRGAVSVGVTYLTDLHGVLAMTGTTEEALHQTIALLGQLGLVGDSTDEVAFTVDLAGRLNMRGAMQLGRGFVALGRILTSDGTPMYLIRKERRT